MSNRRRTYWDLNIRQLSNNLAHLDVGGDIRNELELETIVEDTSGHLSGLDSDITNGCTQVEHARVSTEIRKLFQLAKNPGKGQDTKMRSYNNAIEEAKRIIFGKFYERIEEDEVHLFLKTHFPVSNSTAKDNNILPDSSIHA